MSYGQLVAVRTVTLVPVLTRPFFRNTRQKVAEDRTPGKEEIVRVSQRALQKAGKVRPFSFESTCIPCPCCRQPLLSHLSDERTLAHASVLSWTYLAPDPDCERVAFRVRPDSPVRMGAP